MRSKALVCLGLFPAAAAAAGATAPPMTVSPGSADRLSLIADRCPTFSWGGVTDAGGYELVVYRVADGAAAVEAVREVFPGSVFSWTPDLDRCLAAGGQYAWSVRALADRGASDWSAPALVKVAAPPGELEFLEALAVVQRYLAANPGVAGPPDGASTDSAADPAQPAVANPPEARAPPASRSRSWTSTPPPRRS